MPGAPATFDEAKHPRGQPDNSGQFKRRSLPTPPKATSRRATSATPQQAEPTLFARVMRDCGQWKVALDGRSVGFVGVGGKAEAIAWAEGYMRSNGGGEVAVTDSRGDVQRRYIVRAVPRDRPAKVTVRHAKRGAKVVYGRYVEEDLVYGRATSYSSRAEALERARSHLANNYGGGAVVIQNRAGTVIGKETVPPPEWWLGDEPAPNGSGDGQ